MSNNGEWQSMPPQSVQTAPPRDGGGGWPATGFPSADAAFGVAGAALEALENWAHNGWLAPAAMDSGAHAIAPSRPAAPPQATWHVCGRDAELGFEEGWFESPLGTLDYRLWTPKKARRLIAAGERPPVVVFLHGCKQDAQRFAEATRAIEWAEEKGFVALFPQQAEKSNGWRCWNWFRKENQRRDGGEAAVIAFMAHCAQERFSADPDRIWALGLSAGGAMAVTLASLFPDVFSACASHSGLPFAAATDLTGALGTMKGGAARPAPAPQVPVIVFQGTEDRTVSAVNGLRCLRREEEAPASTARKQINGREVKIEKYRAASGASAAELWTIEGAGHAWSGGREGASYADPLGPDATGEALRFFERASRNARAAGREEAEAAARH